jgi:hypothetical protein
MSEDKTDLDMEKTDFDKLIDLLMERHELVRNPMVTLLNEQDLKNIYTKIVKDSWKDIPLNGLIHDEVIWIIDEGFKIQYEILRLLDGLELKLPCIIQFIELIIDIIIHNLLTLKIKGFKSFLDKNTIEISESRLKFMIRDKKLEGITDDELGIEDET